MIARLTNELRQALSRVPRWLDSTGLQPEEQSRRIQAIERHITFPVRLILILAVGYQLFATSWVYTISSTREVAFEAIASLFIIYVLLNGVAGGFFIYASRVPVRLLHWVVLVSGLMDSFMLGGILFLTGGFESIIFWMFFGLVLHNAICLPIATFQLGLNAAVVAVYLVTGSIDINIRSEETTIPQPLPKKKVVRAPVEPEAEDSPDVAEPFHLRVGVLTLWALWCYALQALFEKGRKAQVEAEEFGIRQEQLQTAGRLAAEIAHKLKNPLSIINNAAFSLQRSLSNQSGSLEQIQIIREEVDRADRILTELMGYARLAEGRVERLSVVEELDRAILTVFPPGAGYPVKVVRDYRLALPSLLMHRGHLSEIFVNLIQNAREAMPQGGTLTVTAEYGQSYSVLVKIRDTGPGIPQEKAVQIFEPYFTTKQKGTGLGLAIVKHNLDIYGGSIEVESELGIGTCFVLEIPAKPLLNLRK